jgi:predicted ATPase/class 3 adenylate cyclase
MATRARSRTPASVRPTGTVTFLFSDVEGSTVRWEGAPDAMAAALARHDALMRAAFEAHGAYVFKTVGDAFCAAFAASPHAMAAALEAQRALAAEDFSAVGGMRVRMALHAGRSDERDGDYFGPTVNRVARLLAIGHGGQVLVSGVAAHLLQGEMPPETSLRDLGEHRLKDLAQHEHVYQLLAPDLPETFPALLSLNYLSNNLPAQLTSFVGREMVVAEIKALLQQHRLVTLVGTGGAGKTRCAIQVGAELVDGSGDGVWLAELAPISDPSLVAGVIARALSVQESPNRPMLDTLLAYLKRKRLLLILDNCEHVIEEARHVVAAILHACPDVHILATSREGLNSAGEQLYRMPSLSVPSVGQTISPQDVLTFGAPLLFVDRAFSVENRFVLNAENAPHVAELCRRLDGIPLAIELAAARVKVLSPKELAQKLGERFRVLTGGDRSVLPRHQTMRALIDWSYDLLSDDERTLFRKLSIFAGAFTLESATAVCGDGEIDELVVLDLLSSLVDKSLVQAEPVGSRTRYRLLESTRQYAREKLNQSGAYDAVARAHATAYLALAEELGAALETMPDRAWDAWAEPELENIRAALEWTLVTRRDPPLGQRLAGMRPIWVRFGAAEGRRWVQAAQALVDTETPATTVAALDLAEAHLASALTQHKSGYAAAERALARYRELADTLGIASAQRFVGYALVMLGRIAEGEALLEQALMGARLLEARRLTASILQGLATAKYSAGDIDGARPLFGEALGIARAIGAERTAASIAGDLAEAEFRGRDAVAAVHLVDEALAAYRSLNETRVVANVLCNMAAYLLACGRYDEARVSAKEALAAAHDAQYAVQVAFALQHLAATAVLQPANDAEYERDELFRAARLLGYADVRLAAVEALREYTERQEYDKMLAALRDALGADKCAKLMNEGSTWSEDQAVAEAMRI